MCRTAHFEQKHAQKVVDCVSKSEIQNEKQKKTSACILHALLINFLFHSDWSYWQKSVIPSTETHENVSTLSNSLAFRTLVTSSINCEFSAYVTYIEHIPHKQRVTSCCCTVNPITASLYAFAIFSKCRQKWQVNHLTRV